VVKVRELIEQEHEGDQQLITKSTKQRLQRLQRSQFPRRVRFKCLIKLKPILRRRRSKRFAEYSL